MKLWITDDGSLAAKGVSNIIKSQGQGRDLSDKCFFIMTGGLPYTAEQHKMMTKIINDPFMIVIIVEIRQRELPSCYIKFQRDYVYYLDGLISIRDIKEQINTILTNVDEGIKKQSGIMSEKLMENKVSVDEKELLIGMLYGQSCKSYAETKGVGVTIVSEYRRNIIKKFGRYSPASLHAQFCVDAVIGNDIMQATLNERNYISIMYYTKLLQDILTSEGVKVLRNLSMS